MDKLILCIWDVVNKPWIRVGLCSTEDDLQESETKGELSLSLRARIYLPECCANHILSRFQDEISDFNLRHKDFTDLYIMEAVAAEDTARKIARALLGDYHSVLIREAEVQRRERVLASAESLSKKPKIGCETIYVALHWDIEYGIQAVGAYRDEKIADLECRMLALDCKYTYERLYRSEFSLQGEVYGSDFFEKCGTGWSILDREGNTAHTFIVEAIDINRPIERKNYSWTQALYFIESEE